MIENIESLRAYTRKQKEKFDKAEKIIRNEMLAKFLREDKSFISYFWKDLEARAELGLNSLMLNICEIPNNLGFSAYLENEGFTYKFHYPYYYITW